MTASTLRFIPAIVVTFALLATAGCTNLFEDDKQTENTPEAPRNTITLKVGTLLPMSGSQATQGESTLTAIQLAANDINEANLGVNVELVSADSGGSTQDIAVEGATELLDQNVSAIIGPRSSSKVLQTYEMISDAKVVQISPASTLPAISEINSNGFFFRTAPSDILQATQLARRILFNGAATIDIISVDDAYSTAIADQAVITLEAAGAKVSRHTIAPGADPSQAAAKAVDGDAILVASGASDFPAIIDALDANGANWRDVYGTDATVEVLRDNLDAPQISGARFSSAGVLANRDLQQAMLAINPEVKVFAFAPEAYDALVLIALSALQAQSSDGTNIRDQIIDVSGPEGAVAYSFEDAAKVINRGENIDYSGLSGPIDFAKNGDPTGAFISFYQYGSGNSVSWLDQKFWQER